jgi:hypothetical protein
MGRFGGMKQHLVSRLRFIAVMLFVGLFSSSLQAVETKTMKYDAPGCKSREDANKVLSMIAVQDFEAMSKFLALRGATGDCVILNGVKNSMSKNTPLATAYVYAQRARSIVIG